jgi:hypothetical protein
MKRETAVWLCIFLLGAAGLGWRAATSPRGLGTVYVQPQPTPEGAQAVRYQNSSPDAPGAILSVERTVGVWIAAFLTLGVLSYLYRDNPMYKLVESIVVGVSAGYTFVVGFWDALVAKLFLKLTPALIHNWAIPLGPGERPAEVDWSYLVPLILGTLLFFRFLPRLEWFAGWPLAFVVGMTAGLKLIVFLEADFLEQIRSTMLPLIVFTADQSSQGARFNLVESLKNTLLVVGVLSSLTYFYFSVEHRGLIRRVARCGIWVLMITFGSSFAFTVMGRITLLTVRMEFLLGRWLGLIEVSQ